MNSNSLFTLVIKLKYMKKVPKTSFRTIYSEFNGRNEYLTNIWILIIIMSFIGIILIKQKSNISELPIPIINFTVSKDYFISIYIILLSGLFIKWTESFIRLIKFSINVLEPFIESHKKFKIDGFKIKTRELYDGLAFSGTNSIWNLVPNFNKSNKELCVKAMRNLIYILLKILTFIVHFFIPTLALYLAFVELKFNSVIFLIKLLSIFSGIFFWTSIYIIIRAIYFEIRYIRQVIIDQVHRKNN